MLCLYCDRPLALLKRLTGDGEFCSKEHRKIYQAEHNQLALARLLESQPIKKEQLKKEQRPAVQANGPAASPAPPPPVEKPAERQPGPAGFISDFLREASAVSVPHRSTGPLFQSAAPVLAESASPGPEGRSQSRPLPKPAAFLPESVALCFAGEVRFPGKSSLEPLAGLPQ